MTSTASSLEVGTSLAGYRIGQVLGRGQAGIVYLAEHEELGRPTALRVLARGLAGSPGFRERFLGDCELVSALDHPGVLSVYDAGEVDGVLYVAMRHVEGADLRSVLRDGPLSTEQTLAIVEQVADALHAAHCSGLVHRDVKPSNIFLEASTHRVYVSDFGVGRTISEPAYCAPERIEGKRLDGRADVYSLGCVLVHCLTGRPQHQRGLGADLDGVVAKALAKDPSERYTTTVELGEAVRKAIASRPPPVVVAVREEAEAPLTLPEQKRPRHRKLMLVGAALALAAGAAAALAVSLGGGNEHRVQAVPAPPIAPRIAASVRDTLGPLSQVLKGFAALPVQPRGAPVLYDYVATTGGEGVRYRSTPNHWCGGALPKTNPCWHDVVPGTGAAEGQRLRIYCYVRGASVHSDTWWAKVRVKPDEYVPTAFLQTGHSRRAATAAC